jgi:hypothetical protein
MDDLENKDTGDSQDVESTDESKAQIEDSAHESELEDEGRKSTIARIADILRGKKSPPAEDVEGTHEESTAVEDTSKGSEEPEAEASEGNESEDETPNADGYEEIDPRFVAAARSYGWKDDRIIEYAEHHDDRDLVMLTSMMERDVPRETEETAPAKKDEPPAAQSILDQIEQNGDIGDPVKQMLKSLVTDLESTKAQLKAVTEAKTNATKLQEKQEWISRAREADSQFDTAAKEFAELGSFDNLKRLPDGSLNPNDPSVKVREQLFKMSVSLFRSGYTWDQAVRSSLQWYKGGREDVVEGKVLQKIKSNAKRLSPKRETRHQTRKFANEQEEKAAVVNQALRKFGVELPE